MRVRKLSHILPKNYVYDYIWEVIFIDNFPNNEEEINLIKFISKYQYLHVKNEKYFFNSKMYYKNRINNLINKKIIKKIKLNLILAKNGIEYSKICNFEYHERNRNKKYLSRLLYLSNIGAFYNNCELVKFNPSYSMKDKDTFTITARRFIGLLEINNFEYLTYAITHEHNKKYVLSVIYDIQKEKNYKNIIVLIDDVSNIKLYDFTFGLNQLLIVENNQENLEKLKYINSIDYDKLVKSYYKNAVLSQYKFCDYIERKNTFISYFFFIDTEKINRINTFFRENQNKNIVIICDISIEAELKKEIPQATFIIINFKKYINKPRIYYYE